jgi:hypothetical protein
MDLAIARRPRHCRLANVEEDDYARDTLAVSVTSEDVCWFGLTRLAADGAQVATDARHG